MSVNDRLPAAVSALGSCLAARLAEMR